MEREHLWRKIVVAKYGVDTRRWMSLVKRDPFGLRVWKAIRSMCKEVERNLVFKVRKGDRVLFWYDEWCGNAPLSIAFQKSFP